MIENIVVVKCNKPEDVLSALYFKSKKQPQNKEKKMVNNKLQETDLEREIANYTFTILPSGKTTVCELILKNGFSVVGVSSCLDIRNFDKDLGEKCALKDAKRKAFDFIAYNKQSEITECIAKETKKECENSNKRAANRTLAELIYSSIDKYNPFKMAEITKSPFLRELCSSNEKSAYKNIATVIANLSENKLDFSPDCIFKGGQYTKAAFGKYIDDPEVFKDMVNFAAYFNELSSDSQRQFSMIMQSVDRELLLGMKRC